MGDVWRVSEGADSRGEVDEEGVFAENRNCVCKMEGIGDDWGYVFG
jgi:hypothetical protein